MSGLTCCHDRGGGCVVASGESFTEAADHEEGIVDSQAQAKHSGEILDENGEVEMPG